MALTKKDKEDIGELIAENNKVLLESVEGVITEKFRDLKNDFQKTEDVLVKEIRDSRDERTVQSHHITRNIKRIEKLETRVFKN